MKACDKQLYNVHIHVIVYTTRTGQNVVADVELMLLMIVLRYIDVLKRQALLNLHFLPLTYS